MLGVVARRSGRVGKTSRNIFHARYSGLTKASATARLAPVCAGLFIGGKQAAGARLHLADARLRIGVGRQPLRRAAAAGADPALPQIHRRARVEARSEEQTSELQSLMRTSYAVFCL